MTKKTNDITLDFLGNSSNEVTESIYLLRVGKTKILLDYGLYQSNNMLKDYQTNSRKIKGLKAKEIDYIIVSHSNIDHIGKIPNLYKNGCTAPIYAIKGNRILMELLWKDSLKIMESDCERLATKHKVKATPLFDQEDIEIALSRIIECDYDTDIFLSDELSVRFYGAGHIVASSQFIITINQKDKVIKRIGYTGDIGNKLSNKWYTKSITPLPYCDLLIGESTYCGNKRNNNHKDIEVDKDKMKHIVNETLIANKGKILIPSFSLDRLQNILTFLYQIYGDSDFPYKVIVDTPLGIKLSKEFENVIYDNDELWKKVYSWGNVIWNKEYKDSEYYQTLKEPMIVLASSGMMVNGRSVSWAKRLITDSKNRIVFCGYAGENTLAHKIKNKTIENSFVQIEGKRFVNNADVSIFNSFGSHASYQELLEYYTKIRYGKLYLVHGETNNRLLFADVLQNKLNECDCTSKVYVPTIGTKSHV